MLHALRRHGYANARGFRDDSVVGLNRASLADAAGVSRPSVSIVEAAFSDSLLDKRPGLPLRLKPGAGYALGVQWGPRHARVAIADLNGQLFPIRDGFEKRFPFREPPSPYLDWTADALDRLLEAAGVRPEEIIGLGISRAAPVNKRTGVAHSSGLPNKEWRDVNAADQLERRLDWLRGVPSITDNDANLSAEAEHTFGAVRDLDDFAYVKWSDSVAAGLMLGGHTYRGGDGYAGQFGHLLIDWRDKQGEDVECVVCGRRGCLETKVGVANIAAQLGIEIHEGDRIAGRLLDLATRDVKVRKRLEYSAELMGEALAPLVDTLNPAGLVLGGWLGSDIHDHSYLLSILRHTLEDHVMGFGRGIVIRRPKLNRSAARGATLRVIAERLMAWAPRAR
ncbi:MAG: hypothetical protein QOH12_3422 [Solirubrobacteraceae bacterium]|nr:hypothetical protein [Solirubrobacteraceae bacterium]